MNKYLLLRVIEIHRSFDFVVSSDLEGDDLQGDEAGGHGEDLGPVRGFVQVLPRAGVGHPCRVTANDVEIGTGYHSRSAVPLNLWTRRQRD